MNSKRVQYSWLVILMASLLSITYAHATCTVSISPSNPNVQSGGTINFTSTIAPVGSCVQTVTWTATAGSIASTSNRTATFTAPLVTVATQVTVTATQQNHPNIKGTTTVTVNPPTLQTITVTPSNSLVTIGNHVQLTATGNYSDGTQQNLTSTATWSSLNSGVASVSAGNVTGNSDGSANITASQNSITSPYADVDVGTAADFYVAPNGSDTYPGTQFEVANGNGPFATICKAQQAVRSILSNPMGRTAPISVLLRGGETYYISSSTWQTACGISSPQALTFTTADGSATLAVGWKAYPNETPVIDGGIVVTGWNPNGTVGNNVSQYVTTLPSGTAYFENLFYTVTGSAQGQRRLRPRITASSNYLGDYFQLTPIVVTTKGGNCLLAVSGGYECSDRIGYTGSIGLPWSNLSPPSGNPCSANGTNAYPPGDISVPIFEYWDVSKLLVDCVTTNPNIIYFTSPTVVGANPNQYPINLHRFVIENVKSALTLPGQFFLDRSSSPWKLYYNANTGENPTNGTDVVIVPQSAQLLIAQDLQNVTFEGITFQHDNWVVPQYVNSGNPGGYASARQDTGVSTAISCQGCQSVTFNGNTITQTAGGGIEVRSESTFTNTTGDIIENNSIYDIGGMGVRVGIPSQPGDTPTNVPNGIKVENNLITYYGRTIPSSIGIVQGNGNTNTYSNNEVSYGYHSSIEICALGCPAQGSQLAATYDVTTEYNLAHDVGLGVTDDMGGIYFNLDPTSTGNHILNNVIYNVSDDSQLDSDGYGGNGIYIDNATTDMDVENNMVYRVSDSTQFQTCGPTTGTQNVPNNIVNNILACPRKGIKQEGCPNTSFPNDTAKLFTFKNNLAYFDAGSGKASIQQGQANCFANPCTNMTPYQDYVSNMYWYCNGSNCTFPSKEFYLTNINGGKTQTFDLSGWQAISEDIGSLIQNPFSSSATTCSNLSYTSLSLSSGVSSVGFNTFDPTQAGTHNPTLTAPTVPDTFVTAPYSASQF